MQSLREGAQSKKETRSRTHDPIADTLTTVYDRVHTELQLFHATEPPIIGKNNEGRPIFAAEGDLGLPDGEVFNAKAASVIGLGKERAVQYCQVNNINEQYKVGRSEDDVPLTKIKIKIADITAEQSRAIAIATSTNLETLKSLKPRFIIKEITKAISELESRMKADRVTFKKIKQKKRNREELLEKLIKLRSKYFQAKPEAKDVLTNEIKAKFREQHGALDDAERKELLQTGLYALDGSVLDMDRYAKRPGEDQGIPG